MLTASTLILLVAFIDVSHCLKCNKDKDKCYFKFVIEHKLTMMNGVDKVFAENGQLYKYDVINTSNAEPVDAKNVISADGWEEPKLVTVVNGKFPGPTIEVYKGQQIFVTVANELENEGVTIHWHGLHQKGTPWMDGVPFVNQCPIDPGQSFRYSFQLNQTGTYWWHSHVGPQIANGVYGAFIIKKKLQADNIERVMMIQDWNHNDDSGTAAAKIATGFYDGRVKFERFKSLAGGTYGNTMMHSGLINGRGRYEDKKGNVILAPLTIFKTRQGLKLRFRVINAATYYPFRISVDSHEITVVASDGYDLKPFPGESVVIWPGERYDFELDSNQPIGNYWIRGLMLVQQNAPLALAILRYEGAEIEDPTTSRRNCTEKDPCLALNCPFPYYPENNTLCSTFNDFEAPNTKDPAPIDYDNNYNYFLNFGFPGYSWRPGSVNGRTFDTPDVNPLLQPKEWQSPCNKDACGEEKICKCTYSLKFGKGKTIQMVFSSLGKGGNKVGHVIHMHGHSFHVLKQGFGKYDEETAQFLSPTTDINCRGNPDPLLSFCNEPKWKKKIWETGSIEGAQYNTAPRKDSVLVPAGGYVVLRFKADNPGLWLIHCHLQPHNSAGMKLLMNETFSEYPKAPKTLPICHSYPASEYREKNWQNTAHTLVQDFQKKHVNINHKPRTDT